LLVALGARVLAGTPEIDVLRVRAEQGYAAAKYKLGFMYANGTGISQDDGEARRRYQLAAD